MARRIKKRIAERAGIKIDSKPEDDGTSAGSVHPRSERTLSYTK